MDEKIILIRWPVRDLFLPVTGVFFFHPEWAVAANDEKFETEEISK